MSGRGQARGHVHYLEAARRPGEGAELQQPSTSALVLQASSEPALKKARLEVGTGEPAQLEVASIYRSEHVKQTKKGTAGNKLQVLANCFRLKTGHDWTLYQYHVSFNPPTDNKRMKLALLAPHKDILGDVRAFDGRVLYLPRRLPDVVTDILAKRNWDNAEIKITIKRIQEVPPTSIQFVHVASVIFRSLLGKMGLKQIAKHYFDPGSPAEIKQHHLQVMSGYSTSVLKHEDEVLLSCDLAFKILRDETVMDQIYTFVTQGLPNIQKLVEQTFIGSIVLTRYNNKTYRVDDICWDLNPTCSFQLANGTLITYEDYYQKNYGISIIDLGQPLFMSKPTKQAIKRGQTGNIYLLPELCVLTGLSSEQRMNFNTMKDVAVHTRVGPEGRVRKLLEFINKVQTTTAVADTLRNWNLSFENSLVSVDARVLPQEVVRQGGGVTVSYRQEEAEWGRDMRGKKLQTPVQLYEWVIIATMKDMGLAQDLCRSLVTVGPQVGMNIAFPQLVQAPNDRNETFVVCVRENVKPTTQMVLVVLPNNKKDRYDAIKKTTCVDRPVPSQMVIARTLNKKQGLMSVATKIAHQLNCKIGGDLWSVEIPLTGIMIVGIDMYRDSSAKGRSCGGVVASMNKECTRYYSSVTFQMTLKELQNGLYTSFVSALKAWYQTNGSIPEKFVIYRDGVGEGQLEAVYEQEIPQIEKAMRDAVGMDFIPKITFVVVKKKISSRFFIRSQNQVMNPPPGTIIDDVITNKEWFDFFLISQSVRQGTVSPTHYNIIKDTLQLKPDYIQRLTYKLTHLYYNWQGTIRVPAPCQYAHKLAFLCGQSIHRHFHASLADKLFFL